MMNPKSDHIFLEPVDRPVTSLIIPPSALYRSREFLNGKVVAHGPKVTDVIVGDEVAYGKDLGTPIEHDGRKYVVITQQQILAVR
jgi:co-chaperonin GroES (HSP10)